MESGKGVGKRVKIATVLGARPQFIKASVVSAEFAKHKDVTETVIHTGQHFDANMSDVFFAELGMAEPEYQLAIHGGNHGDMTGRMLGSVERILLDEQPDAVLIYGDTNSTLAGALAAAKLHIPVAHVEAGLRSFNMRMPEEVNRVLADRLSAWLFTPTDAASSNLQQEGVEPERIHRVGDVMYDVALYHGARAGARKHSPLERLGVTGKGYVLATIHRAENTDDPQRLHAIVEALTAIADELPVVWPLHPRTHALLDDANLLSRLAEKVQLTEPLGYLDIVQLQREAAVIATDSGGIQKEAFFHGVPCVTLRDETEWTELVDAGWNQLTSPREATAIVNAITGGLRSRGKPIEPYGNGKAAGEILRRLARNKAQHLNG